MTALPDNSLYVLVAHPFALYCFNPVSPNFEHEYIYIYIHPIFNFFFPIKDT